VNFVVVPSHAPEMQPEHLTARETALINAYRKARHVAKKHPDALVLGADTIVCLGSKMYGKPADRLEAARMLAELQGHTHEVVTGVCLLHLRHHNQHLFAESTEVTFRSLAAHEIDAYLNSVNTLDKAGAYAIQEHGDTIIQEIQGSRSNVIGLPMERLRAELAAWPVLLPRPST
jgi:septum formation protein